MPFQYSRLVREHLGTGAFMQSSAGVTVTDLDGNVFYDLTGSYGVNIFGNDFYKDCIANAEARAHALGPVLGSYHPVIADNVTRLCEISGLDEVSFHMSGTEAVMQAVRLARYHTRRIASGPFRRRLSRLVGRRAARRRQSDFAARDLYPGRNVGADAACAEDPARHRLRAGQSACRRCIPTAMRRPIPRWPTVRGTLSFDRAAYSEWLKSLREVCTERNIVLIFDEVFVGFRLAAGGAQEYFGVRADMVTYGKSLAGGLPVGAVCGRKDLMRRFRDDRPVDVCFARGTFNSHPYVMTAMDEFLTRLASPNFRAVYDGLDETWNGRARQLNEMLAAQDLPVRVANLSSIWMVHYTEPSRYNWMLQYYLRAEGLALSWVGTGRLIFSLNYTDADFAEVAKPLCRRGREDEAGRLVVARRLAHQQEHPPANPERDAGEKIRALSLIAHSPSWPAVAVCRQTA